MMKTRPQLFPLGGLFWMMSTRPPLLPPGLFRMMKTRPTNSVGGGSEVEARDGDLHALSTAKFHQVKSFHVAGKGLEHTIGIVLMDGARANNGLPTDDSFSLYFLDLTRRIGDEPVATHELHVLKALVFDANKISEDESSNDGIGLAVQIDWPDGNPDVSCCSDVWNHVLRLERRGCLSFVNPKQHALFTGISRNTYAYNLN